MLNRTHALTLVPTVMPDPIKSFQDCVDAAKKRIREISAEELRAKMDARETLLIIDVRESDSHQEGRVPGAVNIPRGCLEMDVVERAKDPNQLIVTHCGGGGRSALAAETLQAMGFKNVFSLAGGLKGWKAKGFSVER